MTEQPSTSAPVGLLCGAGDLPLLVADALRRQGRRTVAVGIKGEADEELKEAADTVHWTGLARLGHWLKVFRRADVEAVLMVGSIDKGRMFGNKAALLPDWHSVKLWYKQLNSREDHTILEAVADKFEENGIPVRSVSDYCPELVARPGCLTGREPTEEQWSDIRFGWPVAKKVAALQIGQCIVVKERTVVAVEGIEGTDGVLRRGGKLARGGAVAVKVAREGHDVRFDMPCVGPGTAAVLEESGVDVMAVEAGKTLILERDRLEKKGSAAGLCIVAVSGEQIGERGS